MIEGPIVKGNKQYEVGGNNNLHPNRASNAVQQHLTEEYMFQFSAEKWDRTGRRASMGRSVKKAMSAATDLYTSPPQLSPRPPQLSLRPPPLPCFCAYVLGVVYK